jgi:hypothetical protein
MFARYVFSRASAEIDTYLRGSADVVRSRDFCPCG